MNKIIVGILAAICCLSVNAQTSSPGPGSDEKEIEIRKDDRELSEWDRISSPDVNVFYSASKKSLTVYLYETEETVVSVFDVKGRVVSEYSCNSGSFSKVEILAPARSGDYWIVVESAYLYAEGSFSI